MSAKAAIWIVSDPRPEHVAAITWLNEASAVDFYMVKVEAVKIGDSPAAPLFTLIVGPSEEAKTVGIAKKEIAERYHIRKRWWTTLIERSVAITKLHAHITPGVASWIGVTTGLRGVNFNYAVWQDECGAEVYIDRGKDGEEENEVIYDQLLANKDVIEGSFGSALLWERLEGKRACRISYLCKDGGYRSPEDQWGVIQDNVVHAMDRLEKAIKPFLSKIKL